MDHICIHARTNASSAHESLPRLAASQRIPYLSAPGYVPVVLSSNQQALPDLMSVQIEDWLFTCCVICIEYCANAGMEGALPALYLSGKYTCRLGTVLGVVDVCLTWICRPEVMSVHEGNRVFWGGFHEGGVSTREYGRAGLFGASEWCAGEVSSVCIGDREFSSG